MIQIGQIFVHKKWSYATFYRVAKVTPKRVVVERMESEYVGKPWDCGHARRTYSMPTDEVTSGWFAKTVQMSVRSNGALWSTKENMYLTEWDGQAVETNM